MELYVVIGAFVVVISVSILGLFTLKSIRDHMAGGFWQLNEAIGQVANVELPSDINNRLDNQDAAMTDLRNLVERRYKTISQIESRRKRREKNETDDDFSDEEIETALSEPAPQLKLEEPEAVASTNQVGVVGKRPRLRRVE